MEKKLKRLFFGLEIESPWPSSWPKGRILDQIHRHVTLNFLGSVCCKDVKQALPTIPADPFQLSSSGFFNQSLLLPETNPRIVAWHIHWFNSEIVSLQQKLTKWLKDHRLPVDMREWLSHLTVCRAPFDPQEWTSFFAPLPCFAKALHLYESLGSSTYKTLWTLPFLPPFQEIEHMADIAFHIYGKNLNQLYENAFIALAFKHPKILRFWRSQPNYLSLDEIIMGLNDLICQADCFSGCPFKAVSFHGEIKLFQENYIQWEMIVDV